MDGRDEIDFITDFAGPLPTLIIAQMMGLPESTAENLKRWSDAILRGYDPARSRETHRALTEAYIAASTLFREVVTARRMQPGNDLISAMVRARDEDARLSDMEIISLCTQLLVAGNVTTTDLMGNGLHALLCFPEEMTKLRNNPQLINSAVEEMLRYDPPITETARIPFTAQEVGGCPVNKGETLTLSLAAANHDPGIFPNPHRFDVTRDAAAHLGFGSGVHFCLGAPLARLEARTGLMGFIARYPGAVLGAKAPKRRDLPFFRGFETLPVDITRR
jgi:cytochrome P450